MIHLNKKKIAKFISGDVHSNNCRVFSKGFIMANVPLVYWYKLLFGLFCLEQLKQFLRNFEFSLGMMLLILHLLDIQMY